MTSKPMHEILADLEKFAAKVAAGKVPPHLPKGMADTMAMIVGAMFAGEHAISVAEKRAPNTQLTAKTPTANVLAR